MNSEKNNKHKRCPICWHSPEVAKRRVRVFVFTLTDKWLLNYRDIFLRLENCGHPVEFIDLTKFSYPGQVTSLKEGFNRIEFTPKIIAPKITYRIKPTKSEFPELREAVASELLSKYKGTLGYWALLMKFLEGEILIRRSRRLFFEFSSSIDKDSLWIIPNGRLSHQRALSQASRISNAKVFYLEGSIVSDSAYMIRPYGAHDRISFQEDVLRMSPEHSQDNLQKAQKWFSDRTLASLGINPYISKFSELDDGFGTVDEEKKLCVMFSSSDDEFRHMKNWSKLGWQDQYESFAKIGLTLIKHNFQVVVRVHPNLVNKSANAVRSEYLRLKELAAHKDFKVIGPNSGLNSYKLMESSDLVVVSVSTLGLESIARGKKVVSTATNHFDLLGESLVFSRFSLEEDIASFLDGTHPDPVKALHWAANQFHQDYFLEAQNFKVAKNRLRSRVWFLLKFTTIMYFLSLWISRFVGYIPKIFYLWKIGKLGFSNKMGQRGVNP